MDKNSTFDVFTYNNANSENLKNEMKKIMKLFDSEFVDIITGSFKNGFEEGEKFGIQNTSLTLKAKICSNFFSTTNLTNMEIYKIIGFGEEKWIGYISEFRNKFEEGERNFLKGQD